MKYVYRGLLLFLTIGVVMASSRYLDFQVRDLLQSKSRELLASKIYLLGFYTHVILGMTALLIGPFQFLPKFRAKYLRTHRNLGKIYVIACLLGGLAGLGIAQVATGGWITRLGFSGLALAWLFTTTQAYRVIRQGQVLRHEQWMLRSFAITFSAVTLRLWIPIFLGLLRWEYLPAYQVISWLCWVPNILVIEWIIRMRSKKLAVA